VARTHLAITVELVGGGEGGDLWPRPGRVLIASRSATFEQLAEAIDDAFARWDRSHLHEFTLEVPGSGTLNADGHAQVQSLSCASAGNCSAGGYYDDGSGHAQSFVVDEVNGTWGNAIEVPGSATLNTGGFASVYSLSCPSAGNCSAGGSYSDGSGHAQAFVVTES
jgi:hypothetical protein